jgi:hypothetical protein
MGARKGPFLPTALMQLQIWIPLDQLLVLESLKKELESTSVWVDWCTQPIGEDWICVHIPLETFIQLTENKVLRRDTTKKD